MQNPVECKDRVVNIAGSAGYDEKSKFPYEYVADVKDEYDQSISLPTSQARVFTYARRCDKDPGSGWSRDTPKSGILLISDLYFIGEGW